MLDRELVRGIKSVSLIGMCKNAGKTTVLNRLIPVMADGRTLAMTSIGMDGEATDTVFGTGKPRITARRGMLVATAEGLLPLCGATRRILEVTDYHTPLGRVVIFLCESDGLVQIAGPSMRDQMGELVRLLESMGAGAVIVDGAINRRAVAVPAVARSAILCTGAAYSSSMAETVQDTRHVAGLLRLPPPEFTHPAGGARISLALGKDDFIGLEEPDGAVMRRMKPKSVFIRGAVTDAVMAPLLASGVKNVELAVGDSGSLLISSAVGRRMENLGWHAAAQRRTQLLMVAANPTSPFGRGYDKNEFLDALRAALPVPVVDVEDE